MAIAVKGFIGRIQNLIYYKMYGKTYVRTVPDRVRQTKTNKARAGEFGRAFGIDKAIRKILLPVIPKPKDNKMQTRLVSALFKWLKSGKDGPFNLRSQLRFIDRFQFNEQNHGVRARWRVALQVSNPSPGLVPINIPAFIPEESITAPSHTVSVICKMATGVCDVGTGKVMGSTSTVLTFNYNGVQVARQTILMKLPTPKGSLIVTGASLQYMINKKGYTKDNTYKNYMPAGIIHAKYI